MGTAAGRSSKVSLGKQNKKRYLDGYLILILIDPETHNWLPSGTFN
jgi:hypothetical protein